MHFFFHTFQAPPTRRRTGFWSVVLAFTVVMAFSTVPTPLYSIYQARDGFSTFMITVIFAAYAVGVILALFFAGHLSDWLGRRRTLVPAVLLSLVSAIVFLVWPDLPGLLLGRVVSGVSVGIVTATATAYVGDLHLRERPGASPKRAQMIATAANLGGLGLGPLISGLLAQYVAGPLTVPFMLFAVLVGVGAIAAALAPETVTPPSPRPAYHPQRIAVPPHARTPFFGAAAGGAASLAAFGLFTSLAPTFLAGTLHQTSHVLAGIPAFTAFLAAVLAQIAASSWEVRRLLATGMATLSGGIALVVLATWLPSLALFLVGGAVAGAGAGLLFKGGIVTVTVVADPERRAEVLAGFFLAGYVGISVPVLGLGLLGQFVEPRIGLLAFAGLLLAGLAVAGRALLGGAETPTPDPDGRPRMPGSLDRTAVPVPR
jgi:MFS family permease